MIKNPYFEEYISTLKNTINFKTILGEKVKDGPFGKEIKDCLNYVLSECEKLGFRTFNNKGYYGYSETKTENNETLVIVGHLDVVPANNVGWISKDPFVLEEIQNVFYGRGVVDDKGPILACLFALKELLEEGEKQKRNVRIVFGTNEETGCKCMDKYSECEKVPDISFTPDSDFPCIYAEKSIIQIKLKLKNIYGFKNIYGGNAVNIVLDKLITVDNFNEEKIYLGKASHSSMPENGENAFIKFLKEQNDSYSKSLLEKLEDFNGKGLNIYKECPLTGKLTMNIGKVETDEDNNLILYLDLRVPKDNDLKEITKTIISSLNAEEIESFYQEYLFIDPNSELIKTLVDSCNKITNKNEKPLYTGGGTYAKHIKNCVAFGPQFKNSNSNIHQNNENISRDDLLLTYNIYKEAIKNLAF